jgi:pyruvoyl-dependent arginine decarboxylase (PvlArgDC)
MPAPAILDSVILRKFPGKSRSACVAACLAVCIALAGCNKEKQAVEGVAQNAVKAERMVQQSASERDQERAQLEQIPLPTKSLYVDVHEPSAWENPFLSIGADAITLRILLPDTNPSSVGQGTMLRPVSARRQEVQMHPGELAKAVVAIPTGAWRYGRVIALAESSTTAPKDRAQARRNVERAIQQLNDLGIVVEEWPSR